MSENSDNATVCYCFRKSVADLKAAYTRGGSLHALQEETRVGTACGGCQVILQSLFGEIPKNINAKAVEAPIGTTCSKPGSRIMKGFILADGNIESTVYSSNAVAPQFGDCDSSTEIEYALVDHRGQAVVVREGALKTNETFIFETKNLDLPRPFYGTFLLKIARANFGASRFNIHWVTKRSTTSTHENSATGRPLVFLPIIVDKAFLAGPNVIHLAVMNPHTETIPVTFEALDLERNDIIETWNSTLLPNASMWLNANEFIFEPALRKLPTSRIALKIQSNIKNIHRAQTVYFFLHNKKADVWSANHL